MKLAIRGLLIFLAILIPSGVEVAAHEIHIPVIVDTDMGLDDVRALSMLLNSGVIDIRLIATSDGAVSPQTGSRNLKSILKYFKRGGIKVTEGKISDKPAPPWRSWSKDVRWRGNNGGPAKAAKGASAAEEIVKVLKSTLNERILYICFGPLTNLAEALRLDPSIKNRIYRLLYFGAHPDDSLPGWNTRRDPDSALLVFDSGIEIYSMGLSQDKLVPFDNRLYEKIKTIKTPTASLIAGIHEPPAVRKLLGENHFCVWDEMIVIYLNRPSLFNFIPSPDHPHVMSLKTFNAKGLYGTYLKLLGNPADFHLKPRQSVVLKSFPSEPALFREDLRPYVTKIIEKYGFEEWKACPLTNELHRHLGMYSLIGAKMGVRAREILEAPFDVLKVVSFAGKTPPLSCMNDGLQVSTGASLGRGTIEVSEKDYRPEAIFLYRDIKLELRLKSVWEANIKKDIKAALKKYGGLNPEYFAHLRKLSIQYWLDLDRQDIFDEVMKKDR